MCHLQACSNVPSSPHWSFVLLSVVSYCLRDHETRMLFVVVVLIMSIMTLAKHEILDSWAHLCITCSFCFQLHCPGWCAFNVQSVIFVLSVLQAQETDASVVHVATLCFLHSPLWHAHSSVTSWKLPSSLDFSSCVSCRLGFRVTADQAARSFPSSNSTN